MTDRRDRLQLLDGLRGVAAVGIVVFHMPWLQALRPPSAYVAVDLFFVLSGFVITGAYDWRLANGELTPLGFIALRLARLYPLYAIGLVLPAALALFSVARHGVTPFNAHAFYSIPFASFMLPAPATAPGASLYALNVPAWSLLFEIVANAVYAFTRRYWTPLRLSAAAILFAGALAFYSGALDGGPHYGDFIVGLLRVGYAFPLGVLLYKKRSWLENMPRLPSPLLLAGLVAVLFLPRGMNYVSVVAIVPVIVAIAVASEPQGRHRLLLWLGAVSYSVYMIHMSANLVAAQIAQATGWNGPAFGTIVLVAVLAAAHGLDRFVDPPLRRWLTLRVSP